MFDSNGIKPLFQDGNLDTVNNISRSVFTWSVAAEAVADEVGAGDAAFFAVELLAVAFLQVGRLGGDE